MARVLLILPPWYRFLGEGFNEIPLGLCYLSAFLKKDGHEVSVLNCDLVRRGAAGPEKIFSLYKRYKTELKEFKDPIWGRIERDIKAFSPDYIGIHAKTAGIRSVLKVAQIAKSVIPNATVVAGGMHATLLPEEMAKMPNIDFVIKGEGEKTFSELIALKEKGNFHALPGLVYQDKDKIIDGGARDSIADIDAIPFPDRKNLMHRQQYSSYAFGIIVTSRGCPFQCSYCAAGKMWPGPVRYRQVQNIMQEIKYVKEECGTKYFNFMDDTFTLNRNRVMEICQRIIDDRLNIVWRCDTRADTLDEELVKIMKRAGCVQASIGIESGTDRILKLIKKGETTEDVKKCVLLLKKYKIPISAFIMIGFPTETREEAFTTISFAKSLGVDTLCLSIVTPYPGTEMYNLFRQNNAQLNGIDYADFYHQSPEMGMFILNEKEKKLFLEHCFAQIRQYNKDIRRLLRRFLIIFMNNPIAVLEKIQNYFYK